MSEPLPERPDFEEMAAELLGGLGLAERAMTMDIDVVAKMFAMAYDLGAEHERAFARRWLRRVLKD